MAKIIKKGLAKAGDRVLSGSWSVRSMVKSSKSTKNTPKNTTGETQENLKNPKKRLRFASPSASIYKSDSIVIMSNISGMDSHSESSESKKFKQKINKTKREST